MKKFGLTGFVILLAAALMFSCASSGGSGGGSTPAEPVEGYTWTFDDSETALAGWEVATAEFWDHKGTVGLSWDETTFGNGMLKMDMDFTNDKRSEWSEPKIKFTFSEPFDMTGVTKFTYDVYYNPEFSTSGFFKSKIIGLAGTKEVTVAESDRINAQEELPNGYLKITMSLKARPTKSSIDGMTFAIVGYQTDYKGPVFVDNLRWE